MSSNLVGFFSNLMPSLSKPDLETDLEISLEYLPVLVEGYTALGAVQKDIPFTNKDCKTLSANIQKEYGKIKANLSRNKNFGADMSVILSNVKSNGDWLLKEISEALNDVVMSHALTAYKANLLRVVPHFYFISRYAGDLLNYLYIKEAEQGKVELSKQYGVNKKQEEFITKNAWLFGRLVAVYGSDHSHFKSKVEGLADITIPKDEVEKAIDLHDDKNLDIFNNLPSGFIGSPIYSIRLIFAQWEADRYRDLKNKRRLFELRLLHLRMLKEQGVSDSNVEQEIVQLQKTVTDYDYKLAKIEESVND